MAAVQGPVDSLSEATPVVSTSATITPVGTAATEPGSRPLRDIVTAFAAVKASLDASGGSRLDLKLLVAACESINILFSLLGVAFSFAGNDYIQKVKDLKAACAEFSTTEEILEKDISAGTVKVRGGHSRNLLRISWALDLNKRLFQYLLQDSSQTLRAVAARAYEEVFLKHHSWAIRSMVSAGMLALPTAHQFLGYLHEDENSSKVPAEEFVKCAASVIKHIEAMFIDKGLGIDW